MMERNRNAAMALLGLALLMGGASLNRLNAEETVGETIESSADDAKKDVKKAARGVKKQWRESTGRHSATEDLKDEGRNLGDEVDTAAKKLKRKAD